MKNKALDASWRAVHTFLPMAEREEAEEIAVAAITAYFANLTDEQLAVCQRKSNGISGVSMGLDSLRRQGAVRLRHALQETLHGL